MSKQNSKSSPSTKTSEQNKKQPIAHLHYWIALTLGGLSLVLYTLTLAPSVVRLFDDSLEFQLVTYQLGIAHPTGYPLFTLLGKVFTFLPIGNIAYRVNWMSAVFGATSVGLIYLLIWQVTGQFNKTAEPPDNLFRHVGAMSGAIFLALTPIFWQQATIAEVYTLNAVFVIALLVLVITPFSNPTHHISWVALIAGLSLTHHRTMVLLFPALVLFLWMQYGRSILKPSTLGRAILFGLLPLLLYFYLPLRGHIGSLDGTYQNDWAGFWRHISGGGYGTTFLLDNPFGHERDTTFYRQLFTSQFFSVMPGIIGLIYLAWRGPRPVFVLTVTAFVTYLLFNISYQVTDIEVFFIPSFLLWSMWGGIGITMVLHQIILQGVKPNQIPLVIGIFVIWLGLGFGQQLRSTWKLITEPYSWQVHDYGLDILQQPLPENSTIIGLVGEMTLLRYFQQTENMRVDVKTIAADLEGDRFAAIETALAEGGAVYLTRELPGAAERWSLNAVGPLIQVHSIPVAAIPEAAIALQQNVAPEIAIRAYTVDRPSHTGDGFAPVRLTVFWEVIAPMAMDLKISTRLLDSTGEPTAVTDVTPVHFAYPTRAWRSGEIVSDVYTLNLPTDTAEGTYTPLIIWYDPANNAAEVGRVQLSSIVIE